MDKYKVKKVKASELFIKALESEGVKYVFTVPGEETLDLIDAIRKSKQIKLIVLRHEQGAGFMAATVGRLTGKPGVCLVTLGPGATNLVTTIAYAQLGGMPMVVISGQKPIKKHKQGRFQVIDVVSMMTPITKRSRQLVNANNIASEVRNAFRIAQDERPGVVHLELPEDIACENCGNKLFIVSTSKIAVADSNSIKIAIEALKKSKKPLLLIGSDANRKDTSEALSLFTEKFQIPFFTTQMGKGVINEKNPYFLGTAALSDRDFIHYAINKADLIINAGHDIIEKPPFLMTDLNQFLNQSSKKSNLLRFNSNKTEVIHINYSPAYVDDDYFPHIELIGDITHTIEEITNKLKIQDKWDFKYFEQIKSKIHEQNLNIEKDPMFPISLPRLVKEIESIVPVNSIISLDNGLYKIWFARNYKSAKRDSLLLDNALATMGAGLPAALAAKLVYPSRNVLAVCGDGGFMMNSQELESAIRLKLNITILILMDNAYGMIKWKQKKLKHKNFGMTFSNPDFVKYAESFGAKGDTIHSIEDLHTKLPFAFNSNELNLFEIPIDYYKKTLPFLD